MVDGGMTPQSASKSGAFRMTKAAAELSIPFGIVVHGPAVGAGLTMLPLADLVWTTSSATFRAPFREISIVPELASSYLLPLLIVRCIFE